MKSYAIQAGYMFSVIVVSSLWLPMDAFAQTRSAYDAGMRTAKKRGYDNPKCYAEVYSTYAEVTPGKGWGVKDKRRINAWDNELRTKCGIAR